MQLAQLLFTCPAAAEGTWTSKNELIPPFTQQIKKKQETCRNFYCANTSKLLLYPRAVCYNFSICIYNVCWGMRLAIAAGPSSISISLLILYVFFFCPGLLKIPPAGIWRSLRGKKKVDGSCCCRGRPSISGAPQSLANNIYARTDRERERETFLGWSRPLLFDKLRLDMAAFFSLAKQKVNKLLYPRQWNSRSSF